MVRLRSEVVSDRTVAANAARAFSALLTEILEPLERLANGGDAELPGRLQYMTLRQIALVRRGERLAAHLLAYAGGQQLNPIRLELLPFLANLTQTLRGVVDKGIDVTAEVGHDCPACEVDAEALEETLVYLTRNALDAMPDGGHLRFSAQADLLPDSRPGNPTVALSVSASGTSTTPQHARRAAQSGVDAKAHDPLAGMRLAAVDGFVRQSGGFVTLEGMGGGMRATLHLPQVGSAKTTHAGDNEASSVGLPIGEARLRGILDSANDAIVTVDDSQIVVMANPAAAQMFRCPIDAVIGAPLEQFIPKRFRDGHRRYMQAFGEGQGTLRTMGRRSVVMGLRGDGEEFPADASISHLSADGRRLYTVILREVTESLRADTALRKSEALLRRLLALLPEAVIVSSGSRISFVNEAAQRLLGAGESTLLGRPFLEILHPDSAELAKSRFLELHDGVSTVPLVEEKILRSDGEIRIVQTMATSFEDRGETSILSAMRDVTELR